MRVSLTMIALGVVSSSSFDWPGPIEVMEVLRCSQPLVSIGCWTNLNALLLVAGPAITYVYWDLYLSFIFAINWTTFIRY